LRATPSIDYGGNVVRNFGGLPLETCELARADYSYSIVHIHPDQEWVAADLATGAGWLLDGQTLRASHPSGEAELGCGSALLFEGVGLRLRAIGKPAVLLLAGATVSASGGPSIRACGYHELHRVEKPWGEELWVNGRHPRFAFKRIVLREGHRTSLQYHEFKRETNLLIQGSARLHYNAIPGQHGGPYQSVPLEAVSAIDVTPGILHRIEAVTDVVLFEVSTPHLDDVMRVSDDTNRADGLIADEHAAGTAGR
jgi:mannose-6-phosphate isomerase